MKKKNLYKTTVVWPLFLALLLPACGGGDTGGSGGDSGAASPFPPVIPASASLSFDRTKIFRIHWTDVSDATYYRLLENPDGTSGYTQISGDIPAGTQSYDYHLNATLYDRLNASYILQSCNARGCNAGNPVFVPEPVALTDAIGDFISTDPTNISSNGFGISVALSEDGNTLVVGAQLEDSSSNGINSTPDVDAPDSGAVFVFTRSGDRWKPQAYIKPSITTADDHFGTKVALSDDGNTLVVGAPFEDGTATDSGAVYVFVRSGSSWSQQAYLKASNAGANDHFGAGVSLSGDGNTLAVGAPDEDGINAGINQFLPVDNGTKDDSGAVYVFTRSNTGWSQKYYIKASNLDAGDRFGSGVSLSSTGNTLAVGAPYEDSDVKGFSTTPSNNNLATDSGAVYVFRDLQQIIYIKASNAGVSDYFGASVDLIAHGDSVLLAIGAPGYNSTSPTGAVYIMNCDDIHIPAFWNEQAYIKPTSIIGTNPGFGSSVSLSNDGNTLVVGAPGESSVSVGINSTPQASPYAGVDNGAAYVFDRVSNTWEQKAYLKAFNTQAVGLFGTSVSLSGSGNDLAVGAPASSGYGARIYGEVYLF